jgi:hypothetical protein
LKRRALLRFFSHSAFLSLLILLNSHIHFISFMT